MAQLGWEAAREWLATLPRRRNVSSEEVYSWLDANAEHLAREIANVPRRLVNEYLQKQHKIFRRQDEQDPQVLDPPMPRFKQSGKWKPVWEWLESLDPSTAIASKEIGEWLTDHPQVSEELEANHSRHNLFKYIQKCYYIVMKKKKKLAQTATAYKEAKEREPPVQTSTPMSVTMTMTMTRKRSNEQHSRMHTDTLPSEHGEILAFPADDDEENQLWTMDKEVVKKRYELLCQLQLRLQDLIANSKAQTRPGSERRRLRQSSKSRSRHRVRSRRKAESSDSFASDDTEERTKRKRLDPPVVAWAYTQTGCSDLQEVPDENALSLIFDRQAGLYSGSGGSRFTSTVGYRPRKWSATFQGWNSLEKKIRSPGIRLQETYYASWLPTWSAYSSNVAVTQPTGRQDQGVQKILDIRFNPSASPQLVCGCNAAPNELLLYDLVTGKSKPLAGHNCQVQAVEYASEGTVIVSCANTTIKVWDSSTAACLYTLGPGTDEENSCGHKKKISAMAVNATQTCLVATSGGQGDCQLLLWNVSTGSLVADLNSSSRQERDIPSMDALEFCKGNLLLCGSDSSYGGPSVVQLWDIDALKECATYPANATYITCLKTNPEGTILVTGSGDGTIGLFDVRTSGGFARLPLGPNCEVTSVSFSSCGRYIQASSTANNAIVWDTRIMPIEFGPKPHEYPPALANSNSRSTRPLHCLSHGKPMPTAENTSQRSGYVDVGDQGINDARWFSNEPVLVTASGNGSIALWDVSLGQPCLRHIQSHSRCINTVAVSPNDEYICSGGDDQKLVLYENLVTETSRKWRLTHPLLDRKS